MSTKETKNLSYTYGLGHSQSYSKSVVSDFLCTVSSDDCEDHLKPIKLSSDIHLLLREKSIHRRIGVDVLRDYVEQLQQKESELSRANLTDDELFQLIEPKSVNNLTSSYMYAKYLKDNSDKVKERYNTLIKSYEDYNKMVERTNSKFNLDI